MRFRFGFGFDCERTFCDFSEIMITLSICVIYEYCEEKAFVHVTFGKIML